MFDRPLEDEALVMRAIRNIAYVHDCSNNVPVRESFVKIIPCTVSRKSLNIIFNANFRVMFIKALNDDFVFVETL